MFDVTSGKYTGFNYAIELMEDTQPYDAKPLPIPAIYELALKKEVY